MLLKVLTPAVESIPGKGSTSLSGLLQVAAILMIVAMNSSAQETNQLYDLNIEATDAVEALDQLADQTDCLLLFPYELAQNRQVNPVVGRFTLGHALQKLLEGSGLSGVLTNQRVISITAIDEPLLTRGSNVKDPTKKKTLLGRIASALTVGLLGSGSIATAEETGTAYDNVIEEIVVTAFKRTQSLQDIPSAISVIGRQDLEEKGIKDMYDLQFTVPSLHYEEYIGGANISIRGIGAFLGNPGVSVSTDEIYQPTGSTAELAQMDIERIEVLRGPQGTLYGRNSNGGVVNFISRAPTPEAEGYVRLGYAEYDELKVAGAYGGPLGERTSFRIAFEYTESNDGWIKNLDPVQDDLMFGESTLVRLRLNSQLTEELELGLIYANSAIDGSLTHTAMFTDNRELTDPTIGATNITLEPLELYSAIDDDFERDYELFSVSVSWDLPFGTLNSISGLQEFDDFRLHDGGAFDTLLIILDSDTTTETFTQELRLSGSNDSLDWIIGAYYMDVDLERRHPITFPQSLFGLPPGTVLNFVTPKQDTESKAVFIDGTWNVTERARISFGARRTEDDISMTRLNTLELTAFGLSIPTCTDTTNFDYSSTTIRAAGQYDLSDNGTIYLSYSEGFKAGGLNFTDCNPPYKPEEIDAYELGGKWTLFSGRTTINAALFHYDYKDFQVVQIIGLTAPIANVGEANINGFELEVWSNLNEHWSINVGITLLDSEYEDFVNLDGLHAEKGFQQLKGNPLNKTPKESINLGIAYRTTLGNGGSLTLRADAAYRSRTYFREFKEREDSQEPYTVVSFNAVWESADSNWVGRFFAKNLTDEEYRQNTSGEASTGGRFGTWGPPRQVGAEVTRRF